MTTKTKAPSAADELETLEQNWADAKAEADNLSREFHDKRERAQDLLELRRDRVHRDPGLVDHRNQPLEPAGEIAQIDRDVAALGDLVDLHARFDHARTLERAVSAAESAAQAVACLWEMLTPDEQAVWLENARTITPRRDVALKTLLPAADKLLAEMRAVDS